MPLLASLCSPWVGLMAMLLSEHPPGSPWVSHHLWFWQACALLPFCHRHLWQCLFFFALSLIIGRSRCGSRACSLCAAGSKGDAAEQRCAAVRVMACLKGGDKWYKGGKCVFQTLSLNHFPYFPFQIFCLSGS